MSEPSLSARIDQSRRRSGSELGPVLPRHPEVASWRTATADDIDAIHAVMVAAERVDHPTWTTPREDVADTFDLAHIDHSRDTVLALDAEGTVIAFGSSFLHPSREGALNVHLSGAVLPTLWRRGIGSAVFGWQYARGLEQLAEAAGALPDVPGEDWSAQLRVYAEESNRGNQRLAESAGLAAERWFATMLRDLTDGAPEVSLPAAAREGGLRIVAYTHDRDDDARLARNDAFRDHWGSLPSQPESWAKFVGGEFFRADLSRLVVEADGTIAAFCLASVNEEDWASLGASNSYIDLIGVVRARRRQGLAPAVVAATLRAIADAGLQKAVLDVDTASPTGADALYEGLGFVADERSVALVAHI
ncbi:MULTISPECIES: GNAT family N-acetyltransferase [Microbacterium]|uniref:GNAT family N-acetyltransferase n=1 Tax=Microbacterium TaxID=33882 RepID=UPI001EF7C8ED|nr:MULTISPECIES: GNAT family N-acetyltransferase [Microbacterium]